MLKAMLNKKTLETLGPGILFAGAAIGTSHLVQSTRAGAVYGLGLIVVILFANFLKYPMYRFGPQYTAATGFSILHGYRALGRWAILLLIATEFPVNIIIVAASALVTSGIGLYIFELDVSVTYLASILIVIAFILIGLGGYKFIDRITKWFVATLTVCTVIATLLTIPYVDWSAPNFYMPEMSTTTLAFVLALLGFMPAGASLAIMHSVWSVEKSKILGQRVTKSEAMLDLNIGYLGSVVLAICFLIMGAGTLNTQGIELSANPSNFAGQVISLYSETLGAWSAVVVGVSVFAVMLSTLLTTLDGFARMHQSAFKELYVNNKVEPDNLQEKDFHSLIMASLACGAIVVLLVFMTNFRLFIDFVTITAFLVAPVIAILNHLVMHGDTVPEVSRPDKIFTVWSYLGVLFLLVMSGMYLALGL